MRIASTRSKNEACKRTIKSNLTDLAGLGIAGSLDLVSTSLCESNAEHPEGVVVSGLDIHMSLDKCLPLTHK